MQDYDEPAAAYDDIPPDPYELAETDPYAERYLLATTRRSLPGHPGPAGQYAVTPTIDDPLDEADLAEHGLHIPPSLLESLNPDQRSAVETLRGPLLVAAGPGSGKTRVLVHRIAALLATGTRPQEILAVTFTNKAAAEMRERVAKLVGHDTASRMWIATFHSACVRILRYHHLEAGLPRSFSIVDAKDAQKLIGQIAKAQGHLDGLNPTETKTFLKQTYSTISRAKNDGKSPTDLSASDWPDVRLAGEVMAGYNRRLAELGAVDFDDILLRTLHLLSSTPQLAAKYQDRFRHILVDEYQDTNAVQYAIVTLLATRYRNLCVVGDADQSIYAFRGADPSVLARFSNTYPEAAIVTLGENYRSTKRIVAVAQAVIDANPAVHRPQLRTSNESGEQVRLLKAPTSWDEARWVVAQIQQRGGDPADHAILVRTNALTRALEQELTENRLPYQVVGALRFYDRAEVKDALAYVRLAVNPSDGLAFARCVNTPKRGIGDATVEAILTEASEQGTSPVEVLTARGIGGSRAAQAARGFLEVYQLVRAQVGNGPAAALTAAADATGLRKTLQDASVKDGLDREANLDELISYAAQFVRTGAATDPEARNIAALPGAEQTEAFLENVALVSAAETATGEDAAEGTGQVSVMTMHAAKGKEFPHVYVVGLEDNICPHVRALNSGEDADLEEERRLLFVAVSRAQLTLDLSYCSERAAFGRSVMNPPSRFLMELPADIAQVTARPKNPAPRSLAGGNYPAGGRYSSRPVAGTSHARNTPGAGSRAATRPVLVSSGPRLTLEQLSVGAQVRHAMFGTGTIAAFDAREVTVVFSGIRKIMRLDLAPLTLTA